MTIRLRLTIWYTGIVALTLLLFGTTFYVFMSMKTSRNLDQTLKDQADRVVSQISVVQLRDWSVVQIPPLNDYKTAGIFVQANMINGKRFQSSNFQGVLPFAANRDFETAKERANWWKTVHIGENTLRIYSARIMLNGELIGVLQVAQEIGGEKQFLTDIRNVLLLSVIVAIVIAATIGWLLARKALQPIDYVITAANQIEKGSDLDKRIERHGPKDEIGKLTDTINSMLDRIQFTYNELEEAYRAQKRFVSDASHELRTPLTTIRGNVELLHHMYGDEIPGGSVEALQDIAEEAERMSRLVNDLLSLARADAGQSIDRKQIELLPIVEETYRKAQLLPKTAEWVKGDLGSLNGVEVEGNADYIQQLLFILIDNAFKYTKTGQVSIDALRDERMIGIRLQDTGIGMNSEEIPQIFDRFYRADRSRGLTAGTGLGLSIAKWIIDEHRGSVEVTSRKGEGSTFVIWFPIAGFPE